MSCTNPECFCKGCSCDPCMSTEDKPCGCDPDVKGVPPKVGRSKPTGRIEDDAPWRNEWKGLI